MEYFELDQGNPVLKRMNFLNGRVDAISVDNNLNIKNANIIASEHQGNIISRNLDCTEISKIFFSIYNFGYICLK